MDVARRKVWECVGCGRIDDPQPCVGICRDAKVEYVLAADHDRALAALLGVVRTIATTTPRPGEAERHWKALQERARAALRPADGELARAEHPVPCFPTKHPDLQRERK